MYVSWRKPPLPISLSLSSPPVKRDCRPASSSSAPSGSEPPSPPMLRLSRAHPPPPWPCCCCCWPQSEGLTQLRAHEEGSATGASPLHLQIWGVQRMKLEADDESWRRGGSCFWLRLCTGGVSVPVICSTYLVRTERSQEAFSLLWETNSIIAVDSGRQRCFIST